MQQNEKTLMVSYNINDIEFDMNLIKKYSTEIMELLLSIGEERMYDEEDIKKCLIMILKIKGYASIIEQRRPYNEAREYLKTAHDDKCSKNNDEIRVGIFCDNLFKLY